MSQSTVPSLAPLKLKDKADRRIKKGHLWIYSNEVDTKATPLKQFEAGQQVEIFGDNNKSLGIATVNPTGLICARIVSRDAKYPLSKSLLVHRLNQALSLRDAIYDQPFYRLVYGDSDWLPGLVVDRFGEYFVVQIATAGMEAVKNEIAEALTQCFSPKGILFKNDHGARELEGLPSEVYAVGDVPEYVELTENGVNFLAPLTAGQKTGWFYDHRENRRYLQHLVKDKRVLDVFSYIGGWGIQAAVAGAREVFCLDASSFALDTLTANAAHNGVADKVAALEGKAQQALKSLTEEGERFDVVIMDPPAFIKKKKDQKSGEAAYYHCNELAMRLLNKNGLLVSASCSMHLSKPRLTELLRASSRHLDRNLQIFYQGGQGADHPIHPAIPETDYLKAQFARVFLSN